MIFLRDHHFGPAEQQDYATIWRTHLQMWIPMLHEMAVESDSIDQNGEPPAFFDEDSIVFLHPKSPTSRSAWINWFSNQESMRAPKGHLVIISTEGGVVVKESSRIHGCYWSPRDFLANSDCESAHEFIIDLRKGSFRPELLQPTSTPAPLLAYTLAVKYRLNTSNIRELTEAADACYAQIQPFVKPLFTKIKGHVSFPEIEPAPETDFKMESPGDPNGKRYKSMRNVIELLRGDL